MSREIRRSKRSQRVDYRKMAALRPIVADIRPDPSIAVSPTAAPDASPTPTSQHQSESTAPSTPTAPHPNAMQTPSPTAAPDASPTPMSQHQSVSTVSSTPTAPHPNALQTPSPTSEPNVSPDLDQTIKSMYSKVALKRTNKTKRTNTPAFGLAISSRILRTKINMKLKQFEDIVRTFVACIGDPTTTGLRRVTRPSHVPKWESWAFCYGFLEDTDVWKLSTCISWQMTFMINSEGWGADSEELWATRPIHFRNNSGTDGLQWANQVRRVFPVSEERHNWATQFKARTRGLRAAAIRGFHDGTKWIHHVPHCFTCGHRTKTFHVLRLKYQCQTCVNNQIVRNRLVTAKEAKTMHPRVTDTLLSQLVCMRFKSAGAKTIARFYLSEHVKRLVNMKRKSVAVMKTYEMANRVGPDADGKKTKYRHQVVDQPIVNVDTSEIQPRNTAAARSLDMNPTEDRTRSVRLKPHMISCIQDTDKRGRGRVTVDPPRKTGTVCTRVIGLDGCTVECRVFDNPKARKRFNQQQRRASAKVCDDTGVSVLDSYVYFTCISHSLRSLVCHRWNRNNRTNRRK